MIEQIKTESLEEQIENARVWIGKKESLVQTKLFSDKVSEWDKENIWEKVLLGLDEIRDDLDEVEGYLETANEYFYEFLREHKVGGD